jgi:hypothetical protein
MRPTKPAAISATKKSVSLYPDQWAWIDKIASERFNGNRSKAIQELLKKAIELESNTYNQKELKISSSQENQSNYGPEFRDQFSKLENKIDKLVAESLVTRALTGPEINQKELSLMLAEGFLQLTLEKNKKNDHKPTIKTML